ncbi:pilus assembly protein TadG-related protein [Ahrensia marina]|uniref:TadE/TadG family type IV pilus assembly protein n=1 Tax=Ahrensia marina TaxID=1514904 RepID=UPI0035CFB7D6
MSILPKWTSHFKSFVCDQRGVVAIIFGIAAIPIMGMVGASLDYSRAANVKSQLQDALDGAILTAAHERQLSDAQLEAAIRTQIEAMISGAHGANSLTLNIRRSPDDETLMDIDASMQVGTTILDIMGIESITVGANAAVGVDFRSLEVALVLDNTGSMRSSGRIASLREAASDFVDVVTEDGESDNVKIALVPYTAQVNIGNGASMEQYLDRDGLSQHHAQLIEGQVIARQSGGSCVPRISGVDAPAGSDVQFASSDASSDRLAVPGFASLSFLDAYGDVLRELVGVSVALAQTVTPYEYVVQGGCIYNPTQISHWQLYQQMEDVAWKGCVEARPEPFDVDDTPPDDNNADTLWVPGFWIDDSGWSSTNNWLSDREPSGASFHQNGQHYSVYKYASSDGHSVDEIPNTTRGPAQNCGDPIVPLTDNFTMLQDRIDDMTYWRGGGTVTAQGVVWGWRTLSPGHPFTEGEPYDEVTKVMVVMTDGRNELVSSSNSALGSHYSAYGHLATGRFPSQSVNGARQYIDTRTLAACANAKAAGIIVYTVTFGLDSSSRAMWDTCASETSMAYHVNSSSELVGAFNEIADSVGELRLTR